MQILSLLLAPFYPNLSIHSSDLQIAWCFIHSKPATQKGCLKILLHNVTKSPPAVGSAHWKLLSFRPQFCGFESLSWPFVKCHYHYVSPIFCVTFNFTPSVIGSHKYNLYSRCQSEMRITTSLAPMSEGLLMGWKEVEHSTEPGASWWLSLLMAAWGWIAAHSTLLHLFFTTFLPLFHHTCNNFFFKASKRWNTWEKADCPRSFSIKAVWNLAMSSRISINYALLPPSILLMIPHRQSTVIPLWNTLWWNKPLCVSSPQYANPGLIMGQP